MIVVSDTTPLRHLIAIGDAELLAKLYRQVIMPTAVWAELQAQATPEVVRNWISHRPPWLTVQSSTFHLDDPEINALDPGEREAIELAAELNADLLLVDDREGRAFALRHHLPVTGTLGVLERADIEGLLVDMPTTIARLEASGFYLSARLREAVLARHQARRDQQG